MKFESLEKAKSSITALVAGIASAIAYEVPKSLDQAKAALKSMSEQLTSAKDHSEGLLAMTEDLSTQLASAQADQKAAEDLASEAGTAQTTAEAALKTEKARADAAEAKVTQLENDQKTVEAEVARICAEAGVEPISTENGPGGEGSILEQYNAITDPVAKGEFLIKHKAALVKESTAAKK